jgi:hypothetical protein
MLWQQWLQLRHAASPLNSSQQTGYCLQAEAEPCTLLLKLLSRALLLLADC